MDTWDHALSISPMLSEALARIDSTPAGHLETVQIAIRNAWLQVIEDAREKKVNLSADYLKALHARLATAAGTDGPGHFADGNAPQDWVTFATEVFPDGTVQGNEHHVVSQLYWGDHVKSMRFSLGWLCMCGLRLQENLYVFYPTPMRDNLLGESLHEAGPECWDGSQLSTLFSNYEREQLPPNKSLELTRER